MNRLVRRPVLTALSMLLLALSGCSVSEAPTRGPGSSVPSTPASPGAGPIGRDVLRALPAGVPPRIGYVAGRRLVLADGTRQRLPPGPSYTTLRVSRVGALIGDDRYFEGTNGLLLDTGSGRRGLEPCTTGAGAVADDRSRLAWVSFSCPESGLSAQRTVHVRAARGGWSVAFPPRPDTNQLAGAAGFVGTRVVIDLVYGVVLLDPRGRARRLPRLLGVTEVARGLVAGYLDAAGRRHGVVDARTGRLLWRTGSRPETFSPSGRRILLSEDGELQVVASRTGAPLTTVTGPPGLHLASPVWEDEQHLLALARGGRSVAVVRLGLDGSVERALPVVGDGGRRTSYVLDGARS